MSYSETAEPFSLERINKLYDASLQETLRIIRAVHEKDATLSNRIQNAIDSNEAQKNKTIQKRNDWYTARDARNARYYSAPSPVVGLSLAPPPPIAVGPLTATQLLSELNSLLPVDRDSVLRQQASKELVDALEFKLVSDAAALDSFQAGNLVTTLLRTGNIDEAAQEITDPATIIRFGTLSDPGKKACLVDKVGPQLILEALHEKNMLPLDLSVVLSQVPLFMGTICEAVHDAFPAEINKLVSKNKPMIGGLPPVTRAVYDNMETSLLNSINTGTSRYNDAESKLATASSRIVALESDNKAKQGELVDATKEITRLEEDLKESKKESAKAQAAFGLEEKKNKLLLDNIRDVRLDLQNKDNESMNTRKLHQNEIHKLLQDRDAGIQSLQKDYIIHFNETKAKWDDDIKQLKIQNESFRNQIQTLNSTVTLPQVVNTTNPTVSLPKPPVFAPAPAPVSNSVSIPVPISSSSSSSSSSIPPSFDLHNINGDADFSYANGATNALAITKSARLNRLELSMNSHQLINKSMFASAFERRQELVDNFGISSLTTTELKDNSIFAAKHGKEGVVLSIPGDNVEDRKISAYFSTLVNPRMHAPADAGSYSTNKDDLMGSSILLRNYKKNQAALLANPKINNTIDRIFIASGGIGTRNYPAWDPKHDYDARTGKKEFQDDIGKFVLAVQTKFNVTVTKQTLSQEYEENRGLLNTATGPTEYRDKLLAISV